MRPSLFLSTLFAMSLFGGAALADGPAKARPTREPRAIEILRHRGDVVDKSYKGSDRVRHDTSSQSVRAAKQAPARLDRAASRINCSDTGADCSAPRADRRPTVASAPGGSMQRGTAKSPIDSKKEQRVNCSAGDECSAPNSMASSRGGTEKAGPAGGKVNMPMASRFLGQQSAPRMACNEGEECSASSKDAKKYWAYEAVKAGTWKGPTAADAAREKRDAAIREKRSAK